MNGFQVGDRVSRQIDVFDPSSGVRTGTILRRYGQHGGLDGVTWFDPEVYDVEFDDGKTEIGFVRHGLSPSVSVFPRRAMRRHPERAAQAQIVRATASRYTGILTALAQTSGVPRPVMEFTFALPRRWRFDAAWLEARVALEIQGGLFVAGRHSRGAALLKEHEKLNAAAAMGWRVLYYTPGTLTAQWPRVVEAIRVPREG